MGFSSACRAAIEGFSGTSDSKERKMAYVDFLAFFLSFIVSMIILGFVGKMLWNDIVVDLFSFAKPATSVWQIIGLMIFVSLLNVG
jgi:hypothetical protein